MYGTIRSMSTERLTPTSYLVLGLLAREGPSTPYDLEQHVRQEASAAADKAQSSWEETRSDAKARLDALKAKAQRRSDQVDADFAASDADWAEADAYAAIDYADWAVENARVAILDAIDARITADEKAAALV